MLASYRARRARKNLQQADKRAVRDFYDWLMFAVELLGFVAVVVALLFSIWNNQENGREMQNAIGSMSKIASAMANEQEAMANQSISTAKLANAAAQQAAALRDMAIATKDSAANAKAATQIAARQVQQNLELFATQQRPIITLDLTSKENDVTVFPWGIVAWKYGFKNVGLGTAFNVTYYESLSVNGAPFQILRRIGSKLSPPGDAHFSGAGYKLAPGELVSGQRMTLTLKVRFVYSDALGRKYHDTAYVKYTEGAAIRDCSYQPKK